MGGWVIEVEKGKTANLYIVGFLDLRGSGIRLHPKDFIVLYVLHHLSSTLRSKSWCRTKFTVLWPKALKIYIQSWSCQKLQRTYKKNRFESSTACYEHFYSAVLRITTPSINPSHIKYAEQSKTEGQKSQAETNHGTQTSTLFKCIATSIYP